LNETTIKSQKQHNTELIYHIHATITHHFPELFDWMRKIEDSRLKASEYELAAHLTACLAMFLFKADSRNEYNQKRENLQFQKNYKKLLGFSMPHGDSVHNVIKLLDESQLEQLNQKMVQVLLKRKVFHKTRYRHHWFRIAIDGTGVVSFDHQHCPQCLHQTSTKGKITYSHKVLDARLVTPNGFSISIASEWIENPEAYNKQDCERKAFTRLAIKLKKAYPRLPLIILADGLYPYEGFFAICKANQWAYQLTFKQGNLQTVWDKVHAAQLIQLDNHFSELCYSNDQKVIHQNFSWINAVDYRGYTLNWLECCETATVIKDKEGVSEEIVTTTYFVHITDLPLNKKNSANSSHTGRMRWKIENEGFNTLKNGGYALKHKWSRTSYPALKNYFQLMQMGYLINQLMVKSVKFQEKFMQTKNHPTLQSLWDELIAAMKWANIKIKRLKKIESTRIQFRFIT